METKVGTTRELSNRRGGTESPSSRGNSLCNEATMRGSFGR
jgi:hypothetical protein